MKLIESPINKNLNLESLYPNITKYLFDGVAINYYKIYALDRVQVIYLDFFDKVCLVLIDTKKKIKKNEVDTAIHRLLKTDREHVTIDVNVKKRMVDAGIKFTKPRKDIILVSMEK